MIVENKKIIEEMSVMYKTTESKVSRELNSGEPQRMLCPLGWIIGALEFEGRNVGCCEG